MPGRHGNAARHLLETRLFKALLSQRLLALFAVGALLFNFPLLALWDREVLVFGLPLFPAALFIIWALLIAALAWLIEGADAERDDSDDRDA